MKNQHTYTYIHGLIRLLVILDHIHLRLKNNDADSENLLAMIEKKKKRTVVLSAVLL